MPDIALSAEEKEIFQVGMEFRKLRDSSAYNEMMTWMQNGVDAARLEYEQAVDDPNAPIDVRNNYAIRYIERRKFHASIMMRVDEIVDRAKQLAEQIKTESEAQ